ncbi:MAG TPA: hypothetical protein VHT96_06480 [Clostridia bacterium]|nr:hypothetical protein [Clostridia bacterium]
MDEKQVFDKINDMLYDTDYPIKITSVADLDDFLLDDDNRRFEVYAQIGRLYDDLRGKPEIDRYPDVSMQTDAEVIKPSEYYDG